MYVKVSRDMLIGYLVKSIGKYDQHDGLKMCIGGAKEKNVPSLEQKPQIPSNKYQNVLHSD